MDSLFWGHPSMSHPAQYLRCSKLGLFRNQFLNSTPPPRSSNSSSNYLFYKNDQIRTYVFVPILGELIIFVHHTIKQEFIATILTNLNKADAGRVSITEGGRVRKGIFCLLTYILAQRLYTLCVSFWDVYLFFISLRMLIFAFCRHSVHGHLLRVPRDGEP